MYRPLPPSLRPTRTLIAPGANTFYFSSPLYPFCNICPLGTGVSPPFPLSPTLPFTPAYVLVFCLALTAFCRTDTREPSISLGDPISFFLVIPLSLSTLPPTSGKDGLYSYDHLACFSSCRLLLIFCQFSALILSGFFMFAVRLVCFPPFSVLFLAPLQTPRSLGDSWLLPSVKG